MKKHFVILSILTLAIASCTGGNTPEPGKAMDAMPKSLKRGVAFNFVNIEDLPLLSPYISWDYNWGNTANDNAALWFDTNDMDYCPMCWNGSYNAGKIREYVAAHPKTKYLLAFNEPNLTDQARMTPKEAAAIWQPVVALAKELNLKLVSPAMNYGTLSGYSDPEKWLDEFFTQPEVDINDIYAISIHCYMASAGGVKSFVEKFYKYNKPIWLTEFCAWDPVPGSVETQMSYMSNVLNYLEQNDKVERYAWFIPRTNKSVDTAPYMQLLTHDDPPALTDLGKMYAYFSSFNKSCCLNTTGRMIHAGEYAGVSDNAIQVRANTDAVVTSSARKEGLKVVNMAPGQAVIYQLNVTTSSSSKAINVRYSSYSDCILAVYIDDTFYNYLNMPRTGDANTWEEAYSNFNISKGMHTVKLELYSGSCNISGFEIAGTDD